MAIICVHTIALMCFPVYHLRLWSFYCYGWGTVNTACTFQIPPP